jgi:hypothetical protein
MWIELKFNSIQFKVIGLNWIQSSYENLIMKKHMLNLGLHIHTSG